MLVKLSGPFVAAHFAVRMISRCSESCQHTGYALVGTKVILAQNELPAQALEKALGVQQSALVATPVWQPAISNTIIVELCIGKQIAVLIPWPICLFLQTCLQLLALLSSVAAWTRTV